MRNRLSLVGALTGTLLAVVIAGGTVVTLAAGLNPKQLFAQNIDQRNAAAGQAAKAKQKTDQRPPLPVSEKGTRMAGILDIQQGPVPAAQFLVTNQWSGPKNPGSDEWYLVFAGAKDPGQNPSGVPALYVETSTPTPDGSSFQSKFVGIFTAPGADGALRITAVNGTIIDLATQGGRVYHFNLATDTYQ